MHKSQQEKKWSNSENGDCFGSYSRRLYKIIMSDKFLFSLMQNNQGLYATLLHNTNTKDMSTDQFFWYSL